MEALQKVLETLNSELMVAGYLVPAILLLFKIFFENKQITDAANKIIDDTVKNSSDNFFITIGTYILKKQSFAEPFSALIYKSRKKVYVVEGFLYLIINLVFGLLFHLNVISIKDPIPYITVVFLFFIFFFLAITFMIKMFFWWFQFTGLSD